MTEFEIDGAKYRIARLNTIQQWHLNRRIAPLIPPLIPVLVKIAKAGGIKGDISGVGELLGPFAEGVAHMSDEDSEYVLNTCLGSLKREISSGNWSNVWNAGAKMSAFPELNDLSKALPLVMKVIWDCLGPFINGLLSGQQTAAVPATA